MSETYTKAESAWQFSLGRLLAAVTILAVICAVVSALNFWPLTPFLLGLTVGIAVCQKKSSTMATVVGSAIGGACGTVLCLVPLTIYVWLFPLGGPKVVDDATMLAITWVGSLFMSLLGGGVVGLIWSLLRLANNKLRLWQSAGTT